MYQMAVSLYQKDQTLTEVLGPEKETGSGRKDRIKFLVQIISESMLQK